MSTAAIAKRIAQLEAKTRNSDDSLLPCHYVIGSSHEELAAEHAVLIASGEANVRDRFINIRIMAPIGRQRLG